MGRCHINDHKLALRIPTTSHHLSADVNRRRPHLPPPKRISFFKFGPVRCKPTAFARPDQDCIYYRTVFFCFRSSISCFSSGYRASGPLLLVHLQVCFSATCAQPLKYISFGTGVEDKHRLWWCLCTGRLASYCMLTVSWLGPLRRV